MAMIIWHDSAREHLRKIFSYYYDNVSQVVAYSILQDVLKDVQGLESAPRKGAPELLLKGRKLEYRRLVVRRRYKVIYFIAEDEAHIVAIWDTRQSPKKLVRTIPNTRRIIGNR